MLRYHTKDKTSYQTGFNCTFDKESKAIHLLLHTFLTILFKSGELR